MDSKAEEARLARRPNYNFEKRQKELKRQKKKEKKLEERRAKKEAAAGGADGDVDGEGGGEETDVAEGDKETESGAGTADQGTG